MKNIFSYCIICSFIMVINSCNQTKPSAILSSQTSLPTVEATDTSFVYGEFEGRIPCQEIARELNMKVSTECTKRKLWLTLYQDSVKRLPTIYKIHGMGEKSGKGRWHIVKGTVGSETNAIFYQLDMGKDFLFLYKGDDNVLFFLDNHKNFLPGNAHFSYTLNRVRSNKSWENWLYLSNRGESF